MSLDHRKFRAGHPPTVRLYIAAAQRWVSKFFDDPVKIESIVQTVMKEILEKLGTDEGPSPERATYWIYGRAHNVVRRELTRMRQAQLEAYESGLHGNDPAEISRALGLREEIARVEAALEDCDGHVREIFEARIRGDSYREIAETHATSEAAARQSVTRLRKRLIGEFASQDRLDDLLCEARRMGFIDDHDSQSSDSGLEI